MRLTSQWGLIVVWWLSIATMASSKPLPPPCADSDVLDILALSLAESSSFPEGVELTKEEGISGYRFDSKAKLVGIPSSAILARCDYFPQEFSIVVTFKRESTRNENEYLLTLLGPDRQTILLGVRLQRNNLNFDFIDQATGQKQKTSFQSLKLSDNQWHTAIITVSRNQIKFNLDCLRSSVTKLITSFPRKLNTRGSRFHIASRRRRRNRFTGLLRQIKFVPGSDASIHLCSSTTSSSSSVSDWLGMSIFTTKKVIPDAFVHFDDVGNVTTTCSDANRGQLMYRQEGGNLEMCEGKSWKKLATVSQERLDYVVDFGELMTKSKTLDIEVFQIPGEGLFLASANQGRDRNMDSTIYKWESAKKRFLPFQNIATDTARHWEYFKIENEHFLAVANHGSDEDTPEARSAIYRWDRKLQMFVVEQYIRTFAARSWESFVIDGNHYLVVANYASQNDHKQQSWVFVWDPYHRGFVKYQQIDTIGAYDFQYFKVENNHYLAVANSYDGVSTNLDSVIYQWRLSNFVPLQYIETFGATDWEHFEIADRHFLAVANYYDNSHDRNTYQVDSYVFEYLPKINQFTKLQSLKTYGALDFEFFTVGRDSYLIASSSANGNEMLTSVIYRWQGMEHFVAVHNISTNPCADWESFEDEDGEKYLVSANVNSKHSKLLHLMTY